MARRFGCGRAERIENTARLNGRERDGFPAWVMNKCSSIPLHLSAMLTAAANQTAELGQATAYALFLGGSGASRQIITFH